MLENGNYLRSRLRCWSRKKLAGAIILVGSHRAALLGCILHHALFASEQTPPDNVSSIHLLCSSPPPPLPGGGPTLETLGKPPSSFAFRRAVPKIGPANHPAPSLAHPPTPMWPMSDPDCAPSPGPGPPRLALPALRWGARGGGGED